MSATPWREIRGERNEANVLREKLIEVVEKAAQDWLHPASWVRHDNGEPLNVNALAAAVVDALRVEELPDITWKDGWATHYRIGALEGG